MRAGIVTINSANFGNRLQNYALQQTLHELGCASVETFRRRKPQSGLASLKKTVRDIIKNDRYSATDRFTKKWIAQSPDIITPTYQTPNISDHYDVFVMGSDQIWNPFFSFNSEQDYLPQVPSNKKIAYAASFGVERLQVDAGRIGSLLADIPHIAMREDAGASIVEELTGKSVPVVLDPTLLLPSSTWEQLESKPSGLAYGDSEYHLHLFLDPESPSKRAADTMSSGNPVVDLSDKNTAFGPQEFVWLIHHAERVMTDSFHATVFSILFHTPFTTFQRSEERADMSSRFTTLERLLGVDCSFSSTDARLPGSQEGICWEAIDRNLMRNREESLAWLRSALATI